MRSYLRETDQVLPLHLTNVLLEIAAERGIDAEAVLYGTSIQAEMLANPEARISYRELSTVVTNALQLTCDPALGLSCGRRMHIGHLGALGAALLAQPDLRSALKVLLRYHALISPAWELVLVEQDDVAILRATPTLTFRHLGFALEVMFGSLCSIGEFLTGAPLRFSKHTLSIPAPSYAARYAELSATAVSFGAERNELWLDPAELNKKLRFADALTARAAECHCAAMLSTGAVRGSVDQVTRMLRDAGPHTPSLTQVARALLTSPRQLRRELRSAGTSYQRVLDDVRKQRAIECLGGSKMTVDQVARELGFQDPRNFRRRFKLWTGCTPTGFRQQAVHLGELPSAEPAHE